MIFGQFLFFCIGSVLCLKNKETTKSTSLTKRSVSQTCDVEQSLEDAIYETEGRVQIVETDIIDMKKTIKELKHQVIANQIILNNIYGLLSKPKKGKSCAELYQNGIKRNGIYEIDPDGNGSFKVLCDMTRTGGGWTVFQRRLDGSVDFYRGWHDYKNGFGDLKGEFWLGLTKIRRLTAHIQNKLRIDLEDTSGNKRFAEYDFFAVTSERKKYQLSLGTYSGDAGDSLSYHKGLAFSTQDSDNDADDKGNCAQSFKSGWWFNNCHLSNLNGQYHHGKYDSYADGINWQTWKGNKYSLKSTWMKIRPRVFPLGKK